MLNGVKSMVPWGDFMNNIDDVLIRTYKPVDIDYIIKRHREIYYKEYGFGSQFGDYVEKYVNEFNKKHDDTKENIWIAESKGKHVFLWTVDKLQTARHLYSKYGFKLRETKVNNSWGENIIEERWDLYI